MRCKSIIFMLAVFLCISCSTDKKETAKIEMKNGVEVIRNPVEPLYGADACTVTEDFTVGVKEGDPEYMFQRISSLVVNEEEQIYVLDRQAKHIKIFDSNGVYIKTFGAPGQGPGELDAPGTLTWTERDGLTVGDLHRVSYFDQDGNFLKSTTMKGIGIFGDADCNGNIYITDLAMEEGNYEIKKFDPELNFICSLGKSPLPSTAQTGRRNPFFTLIRYDVINGDQVVTGYAAEGYVLKVYDSNGELIRRIEKEYVPIEITPEDVEERTADDPPEMKVEYDVPKYFPAFRFLTADDEGRIWIFTWERTEDRTKTYFDIFDKDGIYIAKIALKSRPHVVKNNKLYTIEEDDEGYQYVKRYSINWDLK